MNFLLIKKPELLRPCLPDFKAALYCRRTLKEENARFRGMKKANFNLNNAEPINARFFSPWKFVECDTWIIELDLISPSSETWFFRFSSSFIYSLHASLTVANQCWDGCREQVSQELVGSLFYVVFLLCGLGPMGWHWGVCYDRLRLHILSWGDVAASPLGAVSN